MDNEIRKYVQSCPICQLQKTTRIKNQAKSILPDIPLAPNENALNIRHIKTIAFHPQSNGNIERMHSTLVNLIKTSIAENNKQWDENLKYINFVINTTTN